MHEAWRWRLATAVGFAGGAAAGGTLGWILGSSAWQFVGRSLVGGMLWMASFLLMLFGLVAPLMVVRYFAGRLERSGGEPGFDTRLAPTVAATGRQVGTAAGYVAIVVFYLALAGVGGFLVGDPRGVGLFEVWAVFNAAGGTAWGGIAGAHLTSRWGGPVAARVRARR